MNSKLSGVLNPNQPVPGRPTERWAYNDSLKCGYRYTTDAEYQAFGAVSRGIVARRTLSEMHSELTKPPRDTQALAIGTLADLALVSGMALVRDKFGIINVPLNTSKDPNTGKPRNTPYGRGTKAYDEALAVGQRECPGKQFYCSLEEWGGYRKELDSILAAFARNPYCVAYRDQSTMLQVSGFMWHPDWKCWVKWKPDILPYEPRAIWGGQATWDIGDVKVTEFPMTSFNSVARRFGYIWQGVWYGHCHAMCLRQMGLSLHVANFDFVVVSRADLDDKNPREAMARVNRMPLDPAGNVLVRGPHNALFPKDGLGRVEMFVSALTLWQASSFDPKRVREFFPAYEDEAYPYMMLIEED